MNDPFNFLWKYRSTILAFVLAFTASAIWVHLLASYRGHW
jgi:LPS O-antigen subunit length determinant protein (WzzB/FepE family)